MTVLGTIAQPFKLAPGQAISEDGVYDLTMEQYHGQPCVRPSISTSGLKTLWFSSPAHFYDASDLNPDKRVEQQERPYFSVGRAAHHLAFLGRAGFDREYVVRPEKWDSWRTDASTEWRDIQRRAGLTVLLPKEIETIAGMAKSLAAHPLVRAGILDGAVERSLISRCPETGLYLKARPDNLTVSAGDFSDLKTCESVTREAIERTLRTYGYHMQGAVTAINAQRVLGVEMTSFNLVFVEKTPPYCVEVVTIDPEDILRGRLQVEAMMRVFAECVASNNWPGPGGGEEDAKVVGLDPFARRRIDDRLELLKQTHPYQPHPIAAE